MPAGPINKEMSVLPINSETKQIDCLLRAIRGKVPAQAAAGCFEQGKISPALNAMLMRCALDYPPRERMRLFSYAARASDGETKKMLEEQSFRCVYEMVRSGLPPSAFAEVDFHIAREQIRFDLPLRVNWCGGWTDTPPYCLENGGAVVNAAIKINGRLPVRVLVEKIPENKVVLEYFDSGSRGEFGHVEQLTDVAGEHNPFPLLIAALMVCGVVPLPGEKHQHELFEKLGGGIYISTGVVGIPKGSGLGTSSILLAACIKGIFSYIGYEASDAEVCARVLLAEQLMGTGGGWQDQMGGLQGGIKLVSAGSGCRQDVRSESLRAPQMFLDELRERFCLVYSGKRRLGRTILRQIMSGYIQSDPLFIETLRQTYELALEAKSNIEAGNMDGFIANLNRQTQLTKILDTGFANEELDMIFHACEDMTAGRMICGAGGGGFIQIVLREGFSRKQLSDRLKASFPGQGIDVWDCDFA